MAARSMVSGSLAAGGRWRPILVGRRPTYTQRGTGCPGVAEFGLRGGCPPLGARDKWAHILRLAVTRGHRGMGSGSAWPEGGC